MYVCIIYVYGIRFHKFNKVSLCKSSNIIIYLVTGTLLIINKVLKCIIKINWIAKKKGRLEKFQYLQKNY